MSQRDRILKESSSDYFARLYIYTLIKSLPVEGRAAMTVSDWPLLAELDGTVEFCIMADDP